MCEELRPTSGCYDKERREERRWESLSSGQKLKDWAMRNQYKIILGSWAASMAVAGTIVMRNRYVPYPPCAEKRSSPV